MGKTSVGFIEEAARGAASSSAGGNGADLGCPSCREKTRTARAPMLEERTASALYELVVETWISASRGEVGAKILSPSRQNKLAWKKLFRLQ